MMTVTNGAKVESVDRTTTNWDLDTTLTVWIYVVSFSKRIKGGGKLMKVLTDTLKVSDFLMGALLITAPWLFGIARGSIDTWMAAGFAGYTIIYSLLTCYENMMFIAEQRFKRYAVNSVMVPRPGVESKLF
jgi:hypothetical protein